MKLFKKILVVFDSQTDNRSLLYHAINIAQRNQAALTVVDVLEEIHPLPPTPDLRKSAKMGQLAEINIIEELPYEITFPSTNESAKQDLSGLGKNTGKLTIEIQEYIKHEEQRSLQQFVASIQTAGIPVVSKSLYGIPFIQIIKEVLGGEHDLVMITGEGKGKSKGTPLGNTTMHLMRKCPCPVWSIKPGRGKEIKRVLAAVDLDQSDETRMALNNKIIGLAASLARMEQGELLILNAWRMVGESIAKGRAGFSSEQIASLLQETREMHRQWLVDLLSQHSLESLKYKAFLLKGEAASLITELASGMDVDLIIMGTVSRAGIAGLLIGNTAESVLHQVDSSILAVKPDGFVTPVKLEA